MAVPSVERSAGISGGIGRQPRREMLPPQDVAARDKALINGLKAKDEARGVPHVSESGHTFRNRQLAELARPRYTSDAITDIHTTLINIGALFLNIQNGHKVEIGGERQSVVTIAATEAQTNGDMSQMSSHHQMYHLIGE